MTEALPTGWSRVRVDWLMDEVRDSIGPEQFAGREVFHYSIPALSEFGDGVVENGDSIASSKPLLRGGELLVSKLNPRKGHILIARVPVDPTVCSGEFIVLRPRASDVRFMFYVFSSEVVRQELDGRVQSVTKSHQRVSPDDITKFWIAVPSLEAQRNIADFLDRETARIDALVAERRALLELLQERGRTTITGAMTVGFSMALSRSGRFEVRVQNPDWRPLRLKNLVEAPVAGTWGEEPVEEEDGVPCLRAADFDRGRYRADVDSAPKRLIPQSVREELQLRHGDLLIEKSGGGENQPVGFVVRFDSEVNAICSNFVARLRPRPKSVSEYVSLVFIAAYELGLNRLFIKQTTGIQNIDLGSFLASWWAIPNEEHQMEIVNLLSLKLRYIDRLRELVASQIDLLKEHRQALITAAVTGQMDISGEAA